MEHGAALELNFWINFSQPSERQTNHLSADTLISPTLAHLAASVVKPKSAIRISHTSLI